MDKYDILTLIASACLSTFAYIKANEKPDVQYIEFKTPITITASK